MPVVRGMAGAQAQVLSAAHLSLWARIRDLRLHDVQTAAQKRLLVKAWCMRRTLHLVPSADLAVFVRGSARRAEREVRWVLGRGVREPLLEALIAAALSALDQPLTGPELVERVGRAMGLRVRNVRWGGWGSHATMAAVRLGRLTIPVRYLLHLVAARGVVCSGPNRGVQPTFVRGDVWIPDWRDVPQDDAEDTLLRRYLQAFGPATPRDFAAWTGMPLLEACKVWARQEREIVPVAVEGWTAAVLRRDLAALTAARSQPLPVRLLPYFDSYLLGHKARQHLVALRHHKIVYRPQGWIAPVLLVDGRVAGVWSYTREPARLCVRVTKFVRLSKRTVAAVRGEAESLARFVGRGGASVQIA